MCRMGMQTICYMLFWYMRVGLHIQATTTALFALLVTPGMALMTVGYWLGNLCAFGTDVSHFVYCDVQSSDFAHCTPWSCLLILLGLCWKLQVKPVSERNVLDQKAYILFYIRDSPNRGSTGAQQSTLFSLFPACKQLLSDGASETTDDADTLTDECDSDGCQARREGGYNVSHSYAYGGVSDEPQDGSGPGQTADTPKCCPHLRAVGNSYEFFASSS